MTLFSYFQYLIIIIIIISSSSSSSSSSSICHLFKLSTYFLN